MMKNSTAIKKLLDVFLQKKYLAIPKQYGDFKEYAIKDYENYLEWINLAYANQNVWKDDANKKLVYNTIFNMATILQKDCNQPDCKQNLINIIGTQIGEAYEQLRTLQEVYKDKNSRFLILHIIIDTIFAFSAPVEKIQWSAMFYNLMCRWNLDNSEEFSDFYGVDAETEIIDYTFENIRKISGPNMRAWLSNNEIIGASKQKAYFYDFTQMLLKKMDPMENEENTVALSIAKPNKTEVSQPSEVKLPKTKMPLNSIQEQKNMAGSTIFETEERRRKSSKEEKTENNLIVKILIAAFIFIAAATIGFSIGRVSRNAQQKKMQELIAAKDIQIDELENELKDFQKKYDTLEETHKDLLDMSNNLTKNEEKKEDGEDIVTSTDASSFTADMTLYIYAEKSTDSTSLGIIEEGNTVDIIEQMDESGWIHVSYNEIDGYININ